MWGKPELHVMQMSKWLEVIPVTAATSSVTIDHLRSMFATHGLPKTLVTDNGTRKIYEHRV